MTSIEWLIDAMENPHKNINWEDTKQQAKQMHKDEIIDFAHNIIHAFDFPTIEVEGMEQFYNETFGSEGSGAVSNIGGAVELPQQEIPNDEIFKAALDYDNMTSYSTPIGHFQMGAFWYREQLKQSKNN